MLKAIIVASIIEATPLIKRLNLKKINSKFDIYISSEFVLCISGVGRLNSAIASTHILSVYNIDMIINFGIAGSKEERVGDIYLINKISDSLLNKDFYPDILLRHNLKECDIATYDSAISCSDSICSTLVDMECSSYYFASSKILPPHKIMAIKIVSDNLTPQIITKEYVQNLIEKRLDDVVDFLYRYNIEKKEILSSDDNILIETITDNLRLTFNQQVQLKDKATYLKLNNKVESLYNYRDIKPKDKNMRKKEYERIKQL
jgi:hypothetical protein